MRGRVWRIQYESLQDLYFTCGKYGHKEENCPTQTTKTPQADKSRPEREEERAEERSESQSTYGPWMVAQRSRRRPTLRATKGSFDNQQQTEGGKSAVNQAGINSAQKSRTKSMPSSKENPFGEKMWGSRFTSLNGVTDMEGDDVNSRDQAESSARVNKPAMETRIFSKVNNNKNPKATRSTGDEGEFNIKIKTSHVGMDSSMKKLNGISYVFSAQGVQQAPESSTPKDPVPKDITNKATVRPNKQKYSKPGHKLSGTKRANDCVFSGELAGPPDKIQGFGFSFGAGPMEGGFSGCRPTDPPDGAPSGVEKHPKVSTATPDDKGEQEDSVEKSKEESDGAVAMEASSGEMADGSAEIPPPSSQC